MARQFLTIAIAGEDPQGQGGGELLRECDAPALYRVSTIEPEDQQSIQIRLPRTPEAGSLARALVNKHFGTFLTRESLQNAKLVVSELVNNAYQHGRGQIELEVRRLADRLRVDVVDEGENAAVKIRQEADALGGHGLKIVDALSLAWGAYEGATHVWADIPT